MKSEALASVMISIAVAAPGIDSPQHDGPDYPRLLDTSRLPPALAARLGGRGTTLAMPHSPVPTPEQHDSGGMADSLETETPAEHQFLYVRAHRPSLERL